MASKNKNEATQIQKEHEPESFETGLEELDQLMQRLESGRLPLSEALEAYQRGAVLLQFCQKHLQTAEAQMKVLEGDVLQAFSAALLNDGSEASKNLSQSG